MNIPESLPILKKECRLISRILRLPKLNISSQNESINSGKMRRQVVVMIMYCTLGVLFLVGSYLPCTIYAAEQPAETLGLEEGFVQLNIKGWKIDPFYRVYLNEAEDVYLPLSDVLQELELYQFKINWQTKMLTGTIQSDSDLYTLDFQTGFAKNSSGEFAINTNSYFVFEKEIYLHYRVLEKWLPVKVTWDSYIYEIYMFPEYQLTSELIHEREVIRNKLSEGTERNTPQDILHSEPTWFQPGLLNYQLKLSGSSTEYQPVSAGLALRYQGPLLYGDYTGQVEYDSTRQFTLGLNQLTYTSIPGLQKLIIGDSFLDFSPVIKEKTRIRGISFASSREQLAYTNLTGTAPPQSDVELFYLGELIDYQNVAEGRYHFTQIPMKNSVNYYDLQIYSPNGKIENQQRYVLSSQQLLQAGKYQYQGGVGWGEDGLLGVGQILYGLTPGVTFGGRMDLCQVAGEYTPYLGGVLASRLRDDLFVNFNTSVNLKTKGIGYLGELVTVPDNWLIKLAVRGYQGIMPTIREHLLYENKFYYLDEELSVQLEKGFNGHYWQSSYRLENFAGMWRNSFNLRYSHILNSNTFLQLDNSLIFETASQTEAQIQGSLSYKGFNKLDVQLDVKSELVNQPFRDYQLMAYLTSKKVEQSSLNYSFGVELNARGVDLNGSVDYTLRNGLNLQASGDLDGFRVGLSYQETRSLKDPEIKIQNDSFGSGWVEGWVYLDSNGNRQRDKDEQVFSNVEIIVEDGLRTRTDETGFYRIAGHPYQTLKIAVDVVDLDALYVPYKEVYWIELRPGTGYSLDFGVVPCSGLSGTIKGYADQELSDVQVLLEDSSGEQVMSVAPEYDGFFLIEPVKPGEYRLRLRMPNGATVNPSPAEYQVSIPAGELPEWHDGMNFEIISNKNRSV